MIRLSKKVEYGLIALQHIAAKNPEEIISARELATNYRISYELMGKILQKLAHHHLIHSVQGVKGGYFLAKPLSEINLAEVIEAIEGPLRLADCMNPDFVCERGDVCNIREKVFKIQQKVHEMFESIHLENESLGRK